MTDAERLEKARSALKAILTWSTFENDDMPMGGLLVPEHVQDLCEKTLKETDADPTEELADYLISACLRGDATGKECLAVLSSNRKGADVLGAWSRDGLVAAIRRFYPQ